MDLERISVALRPRTSWEAIDLGLQLVRRFGRSVFVAWLTVFLPMATLVHLVLGDEPAVAFLVVWWLRPFFDRAVLAVLGPGVFGAAPSPEEILRGWPRFIGELFRAPIQLVAALSWRRFSPWRSYLLPVDVLERLPLGERRARVVILARTHRDIATGLTAVCIALELTLFFAAVAFIALLIPESSSFEPWSWLFDSESWGARIAQVALWGAAHTVVEPLYIAGGFGLYLNRRIELEGWDLELSFRRLNKRRAVPVVAVLLTTLLAGGTARAAELASTVDDPQEVILEVLESEAFSDFEEEWVWRWKRGEAEAGEVEESATPDLSILRLFGKAFAKLFFALGVVALLVVTVLILRSLFRRGVGQPRLERGREVAPTSLFGLELARESLPVDVVAAARAAWPTDPRRAFSLLYRGALAHLVHARGLRISESATEGECVEIVSARMPDLASDFEALTRFWQRLAYGRRVPSAEVFEELAQRWDRILQVPEEEAA